MRNWFENVSINKLYVIGIISVGSLIILNQVITQILIHERVNDALVVNIAGKQRMLSQKLALYSFQATENADFIDSLQVKKNELYNNHQALLYGDEERGIPLVDNEDIRAKLEGLTLLVEQLEGLITGVDNQEVLVERRKQIVEAATAFLPQMDRIVVDIQRDSESDMKRLSIIEIIVALLSILILLLEVVVVFKPIVKVINEKTQKLQRAILSRDRILATIVHDLRSPLNGIKGLNGLLKEDLEESLTDDQEMMFDLIDDSTNKANDLIDELLEISVLDNEEFELEMKSVRLQEYLMANIYQFKNRARDKGVELNISMHENELIVNIDPKRFARVIDNLISNALKFTNANGEINIELKDQGDDSVIVISDTGIGIPEKMQPFIFDKFSKARRLGLEGEQTTGLGMSIVKQIVNLHKGDIWVESEEEKGTKFYISLPKAS